MSAKGTHDNPNIRSYARLHPAVAIAFAVLVGMSATLWARTPEQASDSSELVHGGGYVDASLLFEIENCVLPPRIIPGIPAHDDLAKYYWAANPQLKRRLNQAKVAFDTGSPRAFRTVTLVAGSAGEGKTFIKRGIYPDKDAEGTVLKVDVRDLYADWKQQGKVWDKPDLHAGSTVLNTAMALKPGHREGLLEFLKAKHADVIVLDSIDEVHPDDYVELLQQVETFVLHGNREFVHVVVLGRPFAFRAYWRKRGENHPRSSLDLYVLNPPQFRTTGDLLVSSWNYYVWRNKLRWSPDRGELAVMPFPAFMQWAERGFSVIGPFRTVSFSPQYGLSKQVQWTLQDWSQRYRVVDSVLYNLAGNGIIREIAERHVRQERGYDERAVMEEYLQDQPADSQPRSAAGKGQ